MREKRSKPSYCYSHTASLLCTHRMVLWQSMNVRASQSHHEQREHHTHMNGGTEQKKKHTQQRQHRGSERKKREKDEKKNHLATTVDIHWYTSITKHFAFKYWQQREKPSLTTHTSFTSLAEAQRYKTTAAKNEREKTWWKRKEKICWRK